MSSLFCPWPQPVSDFSLSLSHPTFCCHKNNSMHFSWQFFKYHDFLWYKSFIMCSTLGFFLIQGLQSDRVLSESSLYSPLNRLTLAAPSFTLNTWYFFGPYIMAFIHSSQITAPCLPLQIHCITLVYNCSQLPTTKPFPHVPCPTFLIGKFFIILQFRLRPFLNPSGSSACFTCLFCQTPLAFWIQTRKKTLHNLPPAAHLHLLPQCICKDLHLWAPPKPVRYTYWLPSCVLAVQPYLLVKGNIYVQTSTRLDKMS